MIVRSRSGSAIASISTILPLTMEKPMTVSGRPSMVRSIPAAPFTKVRRRCAAGRARASPPRVWRDLPASSVLEFLECRVEGLGAVYDRGHVRPVGVPGGTAVAGGQLCHALAGVAQCPPLDVDQRVESHLRCRDHPSAVPLVDPVDQAERLQAVQDARFGLDVVEGDDRRSTRHEGLVQALLGRGQPEHQQRVPAVRRGTPWCGDNPFVLPDRHLLLTSSAVYCDRRDGAMVAGADVVAASWPAGWRDT